MDLFLLRHADAGEAPRDEDRELTAHGEEQSSAVAKGIAWLDIGLRTIVSSPLPRAVQTANPTANQLELTLETEGALAPGHSPNEALDLLTEYGDRLLLVGHEPQLSGIVRAITGGGLHMRKGMLVRLELDSTAPAQGCIGWSLTWRQLKRLGDG